MEKKKQVFNEELTDVVRKRLDKVDLRLCLACIHANDFTSTRLGTLDETIMIDRMSKTMLAMALDCMTDFESDSFFSDVMDSVLCSIDFSALAKEHFDKMVKATGNLFED